MDTILMLLVFFSPTFASDSNGSSLSFWLFSTYIKGKTQFPEFSYTTTLDDITVGYYNSETYIPRGNTTNEDDVIHSDYIISISHYMHESFMRRSRLLGQDNKNDSLDVYQTLVVCELLDFHTSGKMITKDAAKGCTTDELCYFNKTFSYTVTATIGQDLLKPHLEEFKMKFEQFFYPVCIDTLKNYVKKREIEINRKVKPQVRLIQKASDSGGFVVSCLATGFYPRHINLTLLRDGQPVSDHEFTGGDLLPNGDGTYQMRKSLEISAEEREKHNYTCSAKHMGEEYHIDLVELHQHHIWIAIGVAMLLVCAIIVGLAIRNWKKGQKYSIPGPTERGEHDL
ncbi:major histocompatibility complex class I-related gene protein isoform X1 [Danio rerio]|uniref:Major histocompatibility complex class I-related gene protein isoform X1 n=1 Tax=Danio rerio TaxID=7955 RepID=A0AC58IXG5_DANRE